MRRDITILQFILLNMIMIIKSRLNGWVYVIITKYKKFNNMRAKKYLIE